MLAATAHPRAQTSFIKASFLLLPRKTAFTPHILKRMFDAHNMGLLGFLH